MTYVVSLKNIKRHHVISFIGLCLILLLFTWNSFTAPLERDEGAYGYWAWAWSKGLVPYKDVFEIKPPLIIYTYRLAQLINADPLWPPRLLAFIALLLTIFLLGFIARHEFGPRAGPIAMWITTPMILFPYLTPFAANTERFMILPLTGLLAIYTANRKNNNKWPWFFASACGMLAFLYKPICLFTIIFIFIVWITECWKQDHHIPLILRHISYAVLGGSITLFLVLAPLLIRGAGHYIWEYAFVFNRYYATGLFGLQVNALFFRLQQVASHWWIFFPLLIWFFYKRPSRWWFYLGLVLTGLLAIFPSWVGHYYILVMPFLALLITQAFTNVINIIGQKRSIPSNKLDIITIITVIVMLLVMCWPIRHQFFKSPQQLLTWIYGPSPFLESPIIAKRLQGITNENDYILVVGVEQQILYYAKRINTSRFITDVSLVLDSPMKKRHQRIARYELQKNRPEAIVLEMKHTGLWKEKNRKGSFMNAVLRLINENYQLVGGFVWDKRGGYWKEPINSQTDISNSSFLLFKRISVPTAEKIIHANE